ncbi:DUF1482 family protein, partial [Escherichia coli]
MFALVLFVCYLDGGCEDTVAYTHHRDHEA